MQSLTAVLIMLLLAAPAWGQGSFSSVASPKDPMAIEYNCLDPVKMQQLIDASYEKDILYASKGQKVPIKFVAPLEEQPKPKQALAVYATERWLSLSIDVKRMIDRSIRCLAAKEPNEPIHISYLSATTGGVIATSYRRLEF